MQAKTAIALRLPEVKRDIQIDEKWIALRDELLVEAAEVTVVESQADFDVATDCQNRITKASNALEKMRMAFVKPLLDIGRSIKKMTDGARTDLEAEKARLKKLNEAYATLQRQRAMEERRRQEQEDQERIQKELAEQEAAEALGFDDELEPIVEQEPEPTVMAASSFDARVATKVVWELVDEDALPRQFLMFDQRRVNEYIRDNKEHLTKLLDDGGESPVPGIAFKVVGAVAGTGR